ncbi:MAG: flagellar biosynthesis protein FlhA [Alphaproteobacteria bacterium]|nr:flagellar biosynthesis protein FlhA [Alphaproteobacteria bacterium]
MADELQSGTGRTFSSSMKQASKRSDLFLAAGIVMILVILILPMPPLVLDLALALSLSLASLVLMTSIFVETPIEFTSFPLILLVSTMFRLALNLASTRLILSNGHMGTSAAGHVIEAFGGFVMSGNFVIGLIVFSILVLVNFMVITKGSGRIAEVAARFTLDSMPGKQMAIDADLSAGIIDDDTAKANRKTLQKESAFYGSMDGASKFVRGDAIAGLIITAINVIAGMIIGMIQNDMSFLEAANTYTMLTVGDGLVSQIPALIISISAGIMVSKAGMDEATEKVMFGQLTHYPKALGMSAGMAFSLAVLPGTPFFPFAMLSGCFGATAWFLNQQKEEAKKKEVEQAQIADVQETKATEEPISTALKLDLVRLEMGYGLLSMINDENRRLTDQIKALRRALAGDMGFVMPSVRIQDNMQLAANEYKVFVKEVQSGSGEIRPNMLLVMDPRGEEISISGEKTIEPTFGLPAMWIDQSNREEALFRGYTVVDAPTVVTTHITELIRENMAELFSYTETKKLMDELDKDEQKLVADLVPNKISVGGIQRILQNLLKERISIRDLITILEGIYEATGSTSNVLHITEHVRARLARQISNDNSDMEGVLPLVTMSPQWEQIFAESLIGQGEDKQLSMPPSKLQEFITKVRQTFEQLAMSGETPVLLTSPGVRPYVRSIVERFRPMTVVMSQNEVHPKARIKTVGNI